MDFVTIIAKFKILENIELVKRELKRLTLATRKENGCVDYLFYTDNLNDSTLLLYENWKSEEDLKSHMESDHFIECFNKIEGKFELEVHKLQKLF